MKAYHSNANTIAAIRTQFLANVSTCSLHPIASINIHRIETGVLQLRFLNSFSKSAKGRHNAAKDTTPTTSSQNSPSGSTHTIERSTKHASPICIPFQRRHYSDRWRLLCTFFSLLCLQIFMFAHLPSSTLESVATWCRNRTWWIWNCVCSVRPP